MAAFDPSSFKPIKLIVGLGNPGLRYEKTRHNAGFMVLDALAKQFNLTWQKKNELLLGELRLQERIFLAKPQSFMNLSGLALVPFVRFHKLEPEEILVIYDDLDLPFGRLRLKFGGSSGGQNGIKDLIKHFGPNFARLKVGISRPPKDWQGKDWVLSNFQHEELDILSKIIARSVESVICVLEKGFLIAQNEFNGLDLSTN